MRARVARALVSRLLDAGLVLACTAVQAAVSDVTPAGFVVALRTESTVPRERLYEALVHPERWWNARHTYSGAAANLSLLAEPGGCWCERWPGHGVEHGRVLFVARDEVLRLSAALGPLQPLAVQAVLTFVLATRDGRTVVEATYRVSGSASAQLDRLAGPVDGVLDEQLRRLVHLVESGAPE